MTFTPTPEQTLIIEAAQGTSDNLLVSALAGAAKTSTLVLVAKALSSTPILCLAFNRRIADEMRQRLPGNCEAKTLNALGHAAWMRVLGRRVALETSKTYNIVSSLIEALPADEKSSAYASMSFIMESVNTGKTAGYIPPGFSHLRGLHDDSTFFSTLDEEPTPLEEDLIREASAISIRQAFDGTIDFNDQILLPTTFPACAFPQFPVVLIDEAQDLSELNHAMLRKIARKRLIAVGDECQAIYAFRGASANSMALLREKFSMTELFLSISFRCPRRVVREAQWRAPRMQWPDWAEEGEVTTLPTWTKSTPPDGSAIICRNNAPLFRMALRLLKAGRYPELLGNDIGKGLLKIMKKFGKSNLPQENVLLAIAGWQEEKLAKTRSPTSINDRAECMRIFASAAQDLGGALAYAEHIFNSSGPVKLMTAHKSKGLEFDHVFILDRDLIRTDKHQQEKNLLYVAQSRAKRTLTYITTEGFEDEAS